MKFDISLGMFVLALTGAFSGWVAWWVNNFNLNKQITTQKAVAIATKAITEERDFIHLRNNQLQISSGITTGFDEIERRLDNIRQEQTEIKAYLIRNYSDKQSQ
ncbi:hypothetical protein [Nostoc commune]|uniref:hypothetical protein n=1 Tax=Nostoc commune TaxID=1178 RepID=UPI0018C57989|nr:hypothetical protein [Nostoc commune]MBG1263099.1 hypothetical protein [Nostoc commune BAE]